MHTQLGPTEHDGAVSGDAPTIGGMHTQLGPTEQDVAALSTIGDMVTNMGATEPDPGATEPDDAGRSVWRGQPSPDAIRTKIGLYEIVEALGSGGMGTVYLAWHPPSRRYVALKVIRDASGSPQRFEQLKQLFLREGGILMQLAHPNVVSCFEVNEALHEGKPILYMSLERLDGRSLAARLANGPLALFGGVLI